MKKLILLILSILVFLPINTVALNSKYEDKVASIVNVKKEKNKINLYFFHSETCSHCAAEMEYLNTTFTKKYGNKVNIYKFEVTTSFENNNNMLRVKSLFNESSLGVPFTVVGSEYVLGYGTGTSDTIESIVDSYLDETNKSSKTFTLPILGKIDTKDVSITLVAIVLGFIDGFNPCAMWILLLLINMSLTTNNKKKMLYIGLTFILASGLVYFLSMLGIGFIIDLTMISVIRDLIALAAIILGIYNCIIYFKTRKETGCHVTNKEKRKSIIGKITNILNSKSFMLAILGTIILAFSVNLVELACSLGFPTIFLELLSINSITGFSKILYLLVYILFYLIDDLVVFLIAVFTLKSKGISTKYNKYVHLIGGILMFIMGILLIFKPEWVMFNF